MFQVSQPDNSLFVGRIHHQMEAPEPLHCHDQTAFQRVDRPTHSLLAIGNRHATSIPQLQARTAIRTSVGLCMKASIGRIFIFAATLLAHREMTHGGCRAVVRKTLDNREARTAVRTIGERVKIAAICRIERIVEAIRACGNIRQYQSPLSRGAWILSLGGPRQKRMGSSSPYKMFPALELTVAVM